MKTITRSTIYLPMAAMILTAALAIPAAAQHKYPSKALSKERTQSPIPISIRQAARGLATHLGNFSLTKKLPSPP